MSQSVLVLGGSGLLGSAVARFLSEQPELAVSATLRDASRFPVLRELIPRAEWLEFDALSIDGEKRLDAFAGGHSWIVNAIGVVRQRLAGSDAGEVEQALRVNVELPRALAAVALRRDTRVLQIATDCVYSGSKGGYAEDSPHDARDAYGRSKSLGEVVSPRIHHLRCSIVGLEPATPVSLLGWFLAQPRGTRMRGFTNHRWNGITSLHFAKLVAAIIQGNVALGHLQHVVPKDVVTKHELLGLFADGFGRADLTIDPLETPSAKERSLQTNQPERIADLWRRAGYPSPPSVAAMVRELAEWPLIRSLSKGRSLP